MFRRPPADGGGPGVFPLAALGGCREAAKGKLLPYSDFRSEATWGCLRGRSPFNQDRRSLVIQTKKTGPSGARFFDVWMTGLEPATSWSLTRCATNCATSRGPFFKGNANIGILFRKNKRRATYFSAGPRTGLRAVAVQASGLGAVRASWRAFRAALRAEAARRRRTGPLTTAKVPRSSFSSSGVKLG